MKQYAITTDKASGITNDPNAWSEETGNLRYILDLLKCVIRLSLAPPPSPLHPPPSTNLTEPRFSFPVCTQIPLNFSIL